MNRKWEVIMKKSTKLLFPDMNPTNLECPDEQNEWRKYFATIYCHRMAHWLHQLLLPTIERAYWTQVAGEDLGGRKHCHTGGRKACRSASTIYVLRPRFHGMEATAKHLQVARFRLQSSTSTTETDSQSAESQSTTPNVPLQSFHL